MPAELVIELVQALRTRGADPCVGGGWAVDALVGRQTRRHDDLDLWLPAADLDPAIAGFAALGIDRLLPWGGDRPWNFVLHDGGSRRVDLHLYEVLSDGSLHYGSVVSGHRFPAAALQGAGAIGGHQVRCDAAEWSLRWHTGYRPREVDRHDIALLRGLVGPGSPGAVIQVSDRS
jgi:lincosamide nucleotidyltransferase A/C/D/E